MNVHLNVELSNISKLKPKTVFSAILSGNECLCVLLDTQMTRHTVGVITTRNQPEHLPFWAEFRNGLPCLSYGTECVIEPIIGPESTPRSKFDHRHAAGVLTLTDEGGLLMYFQPFSAEHDEIGYDFRRSEFGHISGQNEASFQRWKLWHNPSDRLRDGAEPLYTFDLQKIIAARSVKSD